MTILFSSFLSDPIYARPDKFLKDEFSPVQPVTWNRANSVTDCRAMRFPVQNWITRFRGSHVNERRIRASFYPFKNFVWTRVNRFSVTIMVNRQHWLFTAAGPSLNSRREVLTNYDCESSVILGSLLKSGFNLQVRNNWNSLGQERQSIISNGGAWSSGWSQSWKELLLTVNPFDNLCGSHLQN